MPKIKLAAVILSTITFCCSNTWNTSSTGRGENRSIEEILQSYIDDFRNDRMAANAREFGIRIPGHGEWCVDVAGKKEGVQWKVTMKRGLPTKPTFIYNVEPETLKAIDSGSINAMTAQGKAFSDDYTPMSVVQMEGFAPTLEELGKINPFSFHFWTRGFPELIPFRGIKTRRAHGSNIGVFYYQPGFRSGWYRVSPGEKVHDGPRERAMPFPMLAIATIGTTEGEIDGKRVTLPAGNAVLIPANANHKWWNETDSESEAIVIMFGEGA